MNIQEAKEQIRGAMTAYFTKDKFGQYRIPPERQRPIFLYGASGIGKTAIMQQIASEMGVGLVSYSMTHHTRQSALGLPYITQKEFEGYRYRVTEYTMSEIIGAIYDMMRRTGVREGILFLDEINCVSETLAPSMLQFLQYKVFGQHHLPAGWIVVTAGNPPEYNKSARDFDIVTWDRMKRIDVEPDYETWKAYAGKTGVHAAVLTYLDARRKDFYKVETSIDGKRFVTPRGWVDLSEMIRLYEENGLRVDEHLIAQYLQDRKIAKDFAIYYDLFNKYRSDYQVDRILAGKADDSILFRAEHAPMDERVSLLGLLFDALQTGIREVCAEEDIFEELAPLLRKCHAEMKDGEELPAEILGRYAEEYRDELEKGKAASMLSGPMVQIREEIILALEDYRRLLLEKSETDPEGAFALVRSAFRERVSALKEKARRTGEQLSSVFHFLEKAFKGDDEMLIFVTELTSNYWSARFIGHYGCEEYFLHNKELQFAERQKELKQRAEEIHWEV